jgi:hypothetical protein
MHSKQVFPWKGSGPNLSPSNDQFASMDSLALLKALVEASAVFVAFTFIDGWSYLASYYSAFGLNPLELDFPIPVVCTTAIYVLFNEKWPLIVVVVLLLAWGVLSLRFPRLSRSVGATVLGLLLLTVSAAGVLRGRKQANENMLAESSVLPLVAFSAKVINKDQPTCVEFQTYGSLDCKLLLHSKGISYFFQPVAASGNGNINVFTLSDSDIGGVHISRGLGSK